MPAPPFSVNLNSAESGVIKRDKHSEECFSFHLVLFFEDMFLCFLRLSVRITKRIPHMIRKFLVGYENIVELKCRMLVIL